MGIDDPDSQQTVIRHAPEAPPKAGGVVNAYLIVLSGRAIGKMFKLEVGSHLIGRGSDGEIQLDDDGVSRKHARMTRKPSGLVALEDLNSTNGTWVNGTRVSLHELTDGDRIQIGSVTILKFSYQDRLEEQFQQQLYESVTRDALTSAYNKRVFEEQLDKAYAHALRHDITLSLAIFDVDHFKRINDTYGHPGGDKVLAQLGVVLTRVLRNEDVFCRVGGEEFAVIMRETEADGALVAGQRFRAVVESTDFRHDETRISVTISVGVASLDPDRHQRPADLYEEADRALYQAKRGGRNRVCVHEP